MKRVEQRGGFASVDAIVALTLLSITLAFCIQAGAAAARASRAAAEARQIEALSRYAVIGPAQVTRAGSSNGLDWRVDLVQDQSLGTTGLALCRKVFTAVNHKSGRRYELQSVSPCPAGSP